MGCLVISYFLDRKGRTPLHLQETFAAVHHRKLVNGHCIFAQLLEILSVGFLGPFVTLVLYISMVSFPSRALQLFRVVSSFPPRNKLKNHSCL